jgi:DNA-binding transcriptional LysR family regulator
MIYIASGINWESLSRIWEDQRAKNHTSSGKAMADLNSLIIFAKVVDAHSFSEAARRLKMPTSTVSRRVAELEDHLGVRLLERSTRRLRLTEIGGEILDQANRSAELSDLVDNIVSYKRSNVSGVLRLSAPPSISDSLIAPLVVAFQASYPDVRVQILITERLVDHIVEGVDLVFRVGSLKDSSLVSRTILTYRHVLLASPDYLKRRKPPQTPRDLLGHRLLAFSRWRPDSRWSFVQAGGRHEETLTFQPYLSMNDFAGLAAALLAGTGIGDLPPIVQPELLRSGRLVEVMPRWRFRTYDLVLLHLGNRHISRPVSLFKEFAVRMAPKLFPRLPV